MVWTVKIKVNCHAVCCIGERSLDWVLISLFQAIEPVGGYTIESVTHGWRDARPMVTFPTVEHHHPLSGTKLYCLVAEAHVCEQIAQGRYM